MSAQEGVGPWKVVAFAYEYADALKAAEVAAEKLWKHLPRERQAAFDAADMDFSPAEKAIRALADAWQTELDGEVTA